MEYPVSWKLLKRHLGTYDDFSRALGMSESMFPWLSKITSGAMTSCRDKRVSEWVSEFLKCRLLWMVHCTMTPAGEAISHSKIIPGAMTSWRDKRVSEWVIDCILEAPTIHQATPEVEADDNKSCHEKNPIEIILQDEKTWGSAAWGVNHWNFGRGTTSKKKIQL